MRNGLGACTAENSSAVTEEEAARLENTASKRFRK